MAKKKRLLKELGLSDNTVKEIEKEMKNIKKQYGWTVNELKGLVNELTEDGKAAKDKIVERVAKIKSKTKISKRTKKIARKAVRKIGRQAARKVRKAGKELAKKALQTARDLERRLQ